MVGERLRQVRLRQQLSLQEVATLAKMSAATLSRIETSKQAIDVETLLELSSILGCRASTLVEETGGDEKQRLVEKLSSLDNGARAEIWRALADPGRVRDGTKRRDADHLVLHLEELLAQVELLRAEIEAVKQRIK